MGHFYLVETPLLPLPLVREFMGGLHWLCFQFCQPTVCNSLPSALYNSSLSMNMFAWWQKTDLF